jgi:hypothetical protein
MCCYTTTVINSRSQQQDTGGTTANSTSTNVIAAEHIELPPCPPSEQLISACRAGDVTGVITALQSCHVTDDEVTVVNITANFETVIALHNTCDVFIPLLVAICVSMSYSDHQHMLMLASHVM